MLSGVGKALFVGGPAGPPNSLAIGTVTTGAAGSQAQATITGTAPAQTLNLVVPKGDQGVTGAVPWAPIVAWYTGQICAASAPATLVYVGGTAYVCTVSHIAGTFVSDLAAGKWAQVAPGGLQPWKTQPTAWAASTAYSATAPADVVTNGGGCYVCSTSHTSGASFDASKWTQIASPGQATGALLAANNLSDLGSVPSALQNLLQAPASPNASGNVAAADVERILRPTGTITRTLPASVPAGWNTDVILNDGTGIVTYAPPANGTLDGVTNGTTLIFPKQRARFFYDTDGWHTVWVERSPILGTIAIPSGSPVASADLALPLGYSAFELIVHGLKVGTAGAILYARLSEDGGSTFHAGSDYNGSLTEFYNATAYTAYSTMSALAVTGQIGTASTWGTARGIITPGGNGLNASALFQASYYFTGGANATSTSGGNMSASTNRQTALRLLFVSGTGSFNAILRGIA